MPSDAATRLAVTVAVPVRNEETNLARCLERLGRFAEIVVIDSGSSDRTPQIAQQFGARLINFQWNGSYPKKRNWFLLHQPPTQPWVLFLDADEYVSDSFCNALGQAIKSKTEHGFWLCYTNYFLGKPLHHGVQQRKLAVFRVGHALYEKIDENGWSPLDMEIHEHPIVRGAVGIVTVPIDHQDDRGIGKFIEKHHHYALWEAQRHAALHVPGANWDHLTQRQRFKYRHMAKWWYPWFYFLFSYVAKCGFLDAGPGFHYASYKAWYFQTVRLLIKQHLQELSPK
jgi:glycosyltransferase involved in cell wall biosynthesis